jgi:hypothetical protein
MPSIDCSDTSAVLRALEEEWTKHRSDPGTVSLFEHLAKELNDRGFVSDHHTGLSVLKQCRKWRLPVAELRNVIEQRVRSFGYVGGTLSLVDWVHRNEETYTFFDSERLELGELRKIVAQTRPH